MSTKKLLIVSGESSGELYGSLVAGHLREDFELFGLGGSHMKRAGVNIIGEITHSLGLFELFGQLKKLKENLKKVEETLKKVDGVILIDFPDFNLKVASMAKKLGKKVLYYVSPQIWAWRGSRIKKIKKYVDYMTVVLPFEERIYKEAKIPVKYVGHPMWELMIQELGNMGIKTNGKLSKEEKLKIKEKFGIKDKRVITLMPGSRPSEVNKKMPLMLNLTDLFKAEDIHFILPKAPNIEFTEEWERKILEKRNITLLNEKSFTALAMSDLAVITSGTSTLQATLLQVPMIVLYRLNPLSYRIARLLVKGVRHIALPNVIADFMNQGDLRVKEFIQKIDISEIAVEIDKILYQSFYRQKIMEYLGAIAKYFYGKYSSKEVYEICKELF